MEAWRKGRQVFLIGNGGSGGNAIHLANDLLYGVSKSLGQGLRVTALTSNSAVLTCLANDEGYDQIFSRQLAVLADAGDVVIALTGSGNSPNILAALDFCSEKGIQTFAITGFSGGKAKTKADHCIHVPIDDMQISEDLQLVFGHIMKQWLAIRIDAGSLTLSTGGYHGH
jgi:D-sedoheptulose 7-phosphate isomerase